MDVVAVINATIAPGNEGTGALTLAHGKPLLAHVIGRLKSAGKLAGIVVSTGDDAGGETVAECAAAHGIPCLKGVRDDLIGRVLAALTSAGAKGGVLIDARCALIDPAIVDQVANLLQMTDGMLDWVGNTAAPGYPPGMEVDGFTAAALAEADRRCAEPEARAQGPAFLRQNSRIYRLLSVTAPAGLQRPEVMLRADNTDDLARIESVLHHFGRKTDFSLQEVLAFLDATGSKMPAADS